VTDDHRATVSARLAEAGLNAGDRFLPLNPGEKGTYDHDDRRGEPPSGRNYGVYATARDRLVLVDVDDYDDLVDKSGLSALAELPPTFEVETPHGGTHRYYAVEVTDDGALPAKVLADAFDAKNPGLSWGEVRAANQYVVGPGSQLDGCDKCDSCADPDGGCYTVQADRPIATIDAETLVDVLREDANLSEDDQQPALGESSSEPAAPPDDVEPRLETALGKDDKLARLWRGDTSDYGDRSRAECALAQKLGWWFGNDKSTVRELMDRSGAEKWAERPDDSYRDSVLEAVDRNTDHYEPGSGRRQAPTPAVPETDGGATATAENSGAGPRPLSALEPGNLRAVAGLGEDDKIADLNDREKAACVWELCRQSSEVHVRVRADNDSLWAYNGGVWDRKGERALRHAARKALGSMNYGANVLAELKAQARADPAVEVEADTFGLSPGRLAVANGLLNLEAAADGTGIDALRDLEPEDYALTRLPVEYDPNATAEEWVTLVEEWAEEGRAHALQEYVGYCLHVGAMPIHRALLLVGSGANGKGTFLHVVRALLGKENTSSIELQTLANERDAVADFYGSVANIDDDLSARKLGSGLGMFKKLVGGDRVRARHLWEDGFEFDATGKHLYAANEVPDVNVPDEDEAFWRRWLLVEFPNHYPPSQRDPDLRDQLTEPDVLAGVLNWAIEGRARLLEHGHFTNEEHYAAEKRARWQAWGDSVDKFIEECLSRDEDAENVSTQQVHRRYAAWCRENGHDPVGQQQLTNTLKQEPFDYGRKRVDGASTRAFGAIAFADEVPALEETPERESDSRLSSF